MPKYRRKEKTDNRGKGDAANDPETAQTDKDIYWTINGGPAAPAGGSDNIFPPVGLIEAEGQDPFNGTWFAQYFDRPAGIRYSMGYTPEKRFFALCLNDLTRDIEWRWFETGADVRRSNLPDELKRRPEEHNRLGPWPHELDP